MILQRLLRLTLWGVLGLAVLWADVGAQAQEPAHTTGMPFLHPLFSDNAVLQRDRPLPVWGWTKPGTAVVVALDNRRQRTAIAAADGRWAVTLAPHPAGGPHSLNVTDAETGDSATRQNIEFGDVWLCGGQSNMAYDINGANNPEAEKAAADHPDIRLLRVSNAITAAPLASFENATWQVCTPQTILQFSGVGYFFGRDLERALKVPIGLIDSTWSGTVGQAWVSGPALATMSDFKPAVDSLARNTSALSDPNTPTALFNGKIAPLIPGQIKGVIWYQGESNADHPEQAIQYRRLLPTLINDWRAHLGAHLPFYIVQLANFRAPQDQPMSNDVWPLMREAQLQTSQRLPNTPLVVTSDLGEVNNVHYHNKQEVGRRLALSALNHTYGVRVESSGPTLRSAKVTAGAIHLTFDHAQGLKLKGDADHVFVVAGADKKLQWATPQIAGRVVTLRSADVPVPVYARFGWSDNPRASLYNSAGLPASPFRTDQDFVQAQGPPHDQAEAVYDAWNAAYLAQINDKTFYATTLHGTSPEGTWVGALDVEFAEDVCLRMRTPAQHQLVNDLLTTFLALPENNFDWSQDTWNDDLAWMTLAMLHGYQITGNTTFLNKAVSAWNISYNRGWDTKYGGGGIWENMDNFVHGDGRADKCSLSNNPFITAGVALYQITGDAAYLTKSEAIYAWVRSSIFNTTTGQVNEGVKWPIGNTAGGFLENSDNVYNSGSFVEAANTLFRVTGKAQYYQDALLAVNHIVDHTPILHDGGRYQTQWAYRFIKGLSEFATDNGLWPQYLPWMMNNARAAWAMRDSNGLTWNDWTKPTDDPKIDANESSSAVAIWQWLPPARPAALSGTYEVVNTASRLPLKAAGSSTAGNVPVAQGVSHGSAAALWTFVPTGGGYYQIKNRKSGLVATVVADSVRSGAKIVQAPAQRFHPGSDEWQPVQNADGTYSFYNLNSLQALDDPGAAAVAGTQMDQRFAAGSPAQRFTLIAQEGQTRPVGHGASSKRHR